MGESSWNKGVKLLCAEATGFPTSFGGVEERNIDIIDWYIIHVTRSCAIFKYFQPVSELIHSAATVWITVKAIPLTSQNPNQLHA
jgi:hypothetical protein